MGDIESLQEAPRTVRILNAARDEIRSQFERYRAQHIDTWDIDIDAIQRAFAAGERIHTENSYKYAPAEFATLLGEAGFRDVRCWQDVAGDFAVFHACARGGSDSTFPRPVLPCSRADPESRV